MVSNALTMRVMARRYRRLAEQQRDRRQREKYLAYASIYSEMALRFRLQVPLAKPRLG
jgi:hypothetical protein